jgi:hypothetical protein
MKILIPIIIGIFCCSFLSGQKIEIYEGINTSFFYNIDEVNGPSITNSKRIGQNIGMSINELSPYKFKIRLMLANYKNGCDYGWFSQGGGSSYHVDINKYVIALEFLPMNFNLSKHMSIHIGAECNCLIYDATVGEGNSWRLGISPDNPGFSTDMVFKAGTWDGNEQISIGAIGQITYEIPLSEEWFFTPQLLFYIGLSDEFKTQLPKTMRPYFEIGLSRKLKNKT